MLASVRTQHASQLEINPWVITYFLALNTRLPPFDDVRVRRALNFAVDRARLRDLTFGPGLGQRDLPGPAPGPRRLPAATAPTRPSPNATGTWTAPDLARARQLVRASGTAGQTGHGLDRRLDPHFRAAAGRYVVSVLDSLGYKARAPAHVRTPSTRTSSTSRRLQRLVPRLPGPGRLHRPTLTCARYTPMSPENLNPPSSAIRAIDREIARAQSLQTSDPEAASQPVAKVDRDLTDQAPWVSFANGVVLEVEVGQGRQLPVQPAVGHAARPALGALTGCYMPIAWYPLSTYSVVPVTFLASSPSR